LLANNNPEWKQMLWLSIFSDERVACTAALWELSDYSFWFLIRSFSDRRIDQVSLLLWPTIPSKLSSLSHGSSKISLMICSRNLTLEVCF
jgi:hypothetical protein